MNDVESQVAEAFRWFSAYEAAGSSPTYEALSSRIADDQHLIRRITALPSEKRQPNLVLAAARYMNAPFGSPLESIEFLNDNWRAVSDTVMERWTQTNEPARAGAFVPLLSQLNGPIALIEVGSSAGLCLFPDRYRFTYDDLEQLGPKDSPVRIRVSTEGPMPTPGEDLQVYVRMGIDRNPLDCADPDDLRWLESCIWPEHTDRIDLLRAAAALVATDPPKIITGDMVELVGSCIDSVPHDVIPVVFHSAVMSYLSVAARRSFAEQVSRHPRVLWISNEAPSVVEGLAALRSVPANLRSRSHFLLGVGGSRVVAATDPHGRWIHWIRQSAGLLQT